jgi:hypothetical protein
MEGGGGGRPAPLQGVFNMRGGGGCWREMSYICPSLFFLDSQALAVAVASFICLCCVSQQEPWTPFSAMVP